jgi:hypothetical protein
MQKTEPNNFFPSNNELKNLSTTAFGRNHNKEKG